MKNIKIKNVAYLSLIIFLSYSLFNSMKLFFKAKSNLAEAQRFLEEQSVLNKTAHDRLVEVGKQIYIEKVARDTLGLAYEKEVIYVLPSEEELIRLSPRIIENQKLQKIELQKPHWQEWAELFL